MSNYYFTFGSAHTDNKGFCLKNHYVKVAETNYTTARIKFYGWAKDNLPDPMQWSFQYPESEFNFNFYPSGELIAL